VDSARTAAGIAYVGGPWWRRRPDRARAGDCVAGGASL